MACTPADAPPVIAGQGFQGSDAWGDIEVPMSLECAGHGQRQYTNFIYPFKCDPPRVADGVNYVGCYEARFAAPPAWAGRRVYLYFEGVASAFHCWVNGEFVGYSQVAPIAEPVANPAATATGIMARGGARVADGARRALGAGLLSPGGVRRDGGAARRRRAQRAVAARPALLRRELHGGAGAAAGVAVGGWA